MKVWQIEDSARAVQFDVVSSPNDWSRGVNRDTRRAANQELSETEQRQIRYWTGLREYMVEKDSPVNCPSPAPSRYLQLGIGWTNFSLMIWQASSRSEIGIWLYVSGDNAEAYFRLLEEQQAEIHTEFGEMLEWVELAGNQSNRICLHKADTDPLDENDWPINMNGLPPNWKRLIQFSGNAFEHLMLLTGYQRRMTHNFYGFFERRQT